MRLKKLICPILAMVLAVSCLSISAGAIEADKTVDNLIVSRATGQFTINVPAHGMKHASTDFPLEAGEVVTIKASYSPFSAKVSFGLIDSDNIFHYVTVSDGSIDQEFTIEERGYYTFAVENNSSVPVTVTGYVNY